MLSWFSFTEPEVLDLDLCIAKRDSDSAEVAEELKTTLTELSRVSACETLHGFHPEPGLEYSWTPDTLRGFHREPELQYSWTPDTFHGLGLEYSWTPGTLCGFHRDPGLQYSWTPDTFHGLGLEYSWTPDTLRGFHREPGLQYSWTPDSVKSSSGATADDSSNMELRRNPIISIARSPQSLIGKDAREPNVHVEGSEKNEIRDENTDEEVTSVSVLPVEPNIKERRILKIKKLIKSDGKTTCLVYEASKGHKTSPSNDGTKEGENQSFEGASISDMLVKPKESCPIILISGSIDQDVECLVAVEERVERPASSVEVHKMLESHKLLESDDEAVVVESVSALEPNTKECRIRKMKRVTKSVGKTMSGLRSIFKRHDRARSKKIETDTLSCKTTESQEQASHMASLLPTPPSNATPPLTTFPSETRPSSDDVCLRDVSSLADSSVEPKPKDREAKDGDNSHQNVVETVREIPSSELFLI